MQCSMPLLILHRSLVSLGWGYTKASAVTQQTRRNIFQPNGLVASEEGKEGK